MNAGGVGDPSDAFVILERLGSGTFGSVWLAAERQSSKLVAVKVQHAGLREACASVMLFSTMYPEQQKAIYDSMFAMACAAGDNVITQGEIGDVRDTPFGPIRELCCTD